MTIFASTRFALTMIFIHAMAAVSACYTDITAWAKFVVVVLIVASIFFYLARDTFRIFPDSWLTLIISADEAVVTTRSGAIFHGKVERNTLVLSHLIVLRIIQTGRRLPISRVLFPDAFAPGEFRELAVRLKFC